MDLATAPVLAKADVTALHYLPVSGKKRFQLLTLFPSLNTSGTSAESLYVDITSKNQLNFKGLKSANAMLTVTTVSNNLVLTVVPSALDLDDMDNTTAQFLKTVSLTTNVTGTLPVANGGTGKTTIAKGAILYGSATGTISETSAMSTNGQLLIGNASTGVPSVATLTAGTNVTVTNGAGSITVSAALETLTANLDADIYHINLNAAAGYSFLSGDGTAEGVTVDANGYVFIGNATPTVPTLSSQLTLGGTATTALVIGNTNHYADRTIQVQSASGATDGINLNFYGANGGTGNRAGGSLTFKAGAAAGTGTAGSLTLSSGDPGASGSVGKVIFKNYISTVQTTVGEFSGGNLVMEKGSPITNYTNTRTGAGALDPTRPTNFIVTTGANALTLADGTEGQSLFIHMITDAGDGTLTPTNPSGFSTITFNDVGDSVHLRFINAKWYIVGSHGVTIA